MPGRSQAEEHRSLDTSKESGHEGEQVVVRKKVEDSLRHTFTTHGGNSGVPMPVMQSLLGHTSAEMTMLYTHPLDAAQRKAVERLSQVLFPNVPSEQRVVAEGSTLIQ